MASLKNVLGKAYHYWVHSEDEVLYVCRKFKRENHTHRHMIMCMTICTPPVFSSL